MGNPINRISKFFGQDDFDLHIDLGMEYFQSDVNMTVKLYKINHLQSDSDDIYAESTSSQIKYSDPIDIQCLVKIDTPQNKSYVDNKIRFNEPGNLIITVYKKTLENLKTDINYGDFISYQIDENTLFYYEVSDDGKQPQNAKSAFGFKYHYRTIICTPTQKNLFKG